MLGAEPEQAPAAGAQPSGGDAAEVSQQLRALATLLSIDARFQQASQLIGAINEAAQAKMRALPQSFHQPMLPEGSISNDQVRPAFSILFGVYLIAVCLSMKANFDVQAGTLRRWCLASKPTA